MTLMEEAAAFIEAVSIEFAEQDGEYWLTFAAPYYVGYNLGQRQTVNAGVSIITRNTERWRDARSDLLTRLKAALVEGVKPTRWHEGMRALTPDDSDLVMAAAIRLCWAYLGEGEVCIRTRGHDNNAHEPEAKP